MISNKLKKKQEIEQKIMELEKEIRTLKNEKKSIDIDILKQCEHNWILDVDHFQYDERPRKCTKCLMYRD